MLRIPTTKAARHATIQMILEAEQISSQGELKQRLEDKGITVTQATLSRDLLELRATKMRTETGKQIYTLGSSEPERPQSHTSRLTRWCQEILISVDLALNQVVLRTPPGAAQMLGLAIDQGQLEGVVGTVAGDDTILLICRDIESAEQTSEWLVSLVNSSAPSSQ